MSAGASSSRLSRLSASMAERRRESSNNVLDLVTLGLRDSREKDVTELFVELRERLFDFSGTSDADDDITMIGLKICDSGQAAAAGAGAQ